MDRCIHAFNRRTIEFFGLAFVLSFASQLWGWQESLSSEFRIGLEQITIGRVTGTISFLASDELKGRATGSPQFDIAASYVAARLRGAGLEGGGSNGSFYHETQVEMPRNPSDCLLESQDKQSLEHLAVLAAPSERLVYQGSLKSIDIESEIPANGLEGVVYGKIGGDSKGNSLIVQAMRLASAVKGAGAQALLLGVPPQCELTSLAIDRQEPYLDSNRSRLSLPIVLVPDSLSLPAWIRLEIPPRKVASVTMRNVIGLLRGTDPELSKETILFSAHLDHLGAKSGEGDRIYNGADDDATGVTAVVTLADGFGAIPRCKRSLLFMTFWGEESGLLGSKQYVETPTWPLEKVVANVNIEMIGRPEPGAGGKIWMTGWKASDLGSLMNRASQRIGVEIFEHPKFSEPLYKASDNWSFVSKGIVAHSFSAGSLHADYHQPDDEWERLEIPHMTKVIQGLFVGALPLATGEMTPSKSERSASDR